MTRLALASLFVLTACANTALPPEAIARRACTSEGMWCQDAQHGRCCRGLSCEDSRCVKKAPKGDEAPARERL